MGGGYKDNSRWKQVWNHRLVNSDNLVQTDEYALYKELKRLDGFDVQVEDQEAYYKSFYDAVNEIYKTNLASVESVYEVGCGSGANLIIYKNKGKKVGGVDYSEQLVNVARKLLPECDIMMDEAVNITSDEMYDVVISDSVFAYFPNEEYGMEVLKKMYDKARSQVILLEIFDKDMEDECNAYRRASVENYDEKYVGLDKIFYPRQMFVDFAEKYGCRIEFTKVKNKYYWNSKYMYNCYIYK